MIQQVKGYVRGIANAAKRGKMMTSDGYMKVVDRLSNKLAYPEVRDQKLRESEATLQRIKIKMNRKK